MAVLVLLLAVAAAGAVGARLVGAARGDRLLVAAVIALSTLFTVHGALGLAQALGSRPAPIDPMRPPTTLVVDRGGAGPPISIPRDYVWPPWVAPLPAAGLVLAGVAVAAAVVRLRGRRRQVALPAAPGGSGWLAGAPSWTVALLAAAGATLLAAAVAALGPPRGYDALWYHLPMATFFAKQSSLGPFSDEVVAFFPGNGELWMSLGVRLGLERTLNLGQLPFALLLALGASRLAASTGLRRGRLLAAACVLGTPLVILQSTTAYLDVMAAAALVASAVFVTRFARLGRRVDVALAGLAAGVAVGTKYAALPPVLVLGGAVLLAGLEVFRPLALRDPSARRLLTAGLAGLIFVAALLPPGAFWYWRNARLTGNPVFPVTLRLAGVELAGIAPPEGFNVGKEKEFVPSPWRWIDQPFHERYSFESGFGAPLAVLAPLVALLMALLTLDRLGRSAPLPLASLPLLLSMGCLFLWAKGSREARHLLPAATLLLPLVALLVRGRREGEAPGEGGARGMDWMGRLAPWIAAAVLGTLLVVARTVLFSTSHELGPVLGTSREQYYALPASFDELPPGTVIENRAGRPYNDPALGRRRAYRLRPFVDGPAPDLRTLRYHAVRYVLWRGLPGEPRPPGRVHWSRPVHDHPWWDARPGLLLELIELDPYR